MVSVINPTTNTITATIHGGDSPVSVAVSPTGPAAGDIYVGGTITTTLAGSVSVIQPRHLR